MSNPYDLCLEQRPRAWTTVPPPDIQPVLPRLTAGGRWRTAQAEAGVGWGTRGWLLTAFVVFSFIASFSVVAVQHFDHCRVQCLWTAQARQDQQRLREVQRDNLALAAALNTPMQRDDRAPQPSTIPAKFVCRPPVGGSRL